MEEKQIATPKKTIPQKPAVAAEVKEEKPTQPAPVVESEGKSTEQVAQTPTNAQSTKSAQPQKTEKQKEPLSKQSKEILFGLLGGFSLVIAIVCFVLMFVI